MSWIISPERNALITGDLLQCKIFLRKLREVGPDGDRDIRKALTLAAKVSYCRPFKFSRDKDGARVTWMPSEIIEFLNDDLRRVHERVKEERDEALARTDWAAHEPKIHRSGDPPSVSGVMMRDPWIPMESSEIDDLERLVRTVDELYTSNKQVVYELS